MMINQLLYWSWSCYLFSQISYAFAEIINIPNIKYRKYIISIFCVIHFLLGLLYPIIFDSALIYGTITTFCLTGVFMISEYFYSMKKLRKKGNAHMILGILLVSGTCCFLTPVLIFFKTQFSKLPFGTFYVIL